MKTEDYKNVIKFLSFIIVILLISAILQSFIIKDKECRVELYSGTKNYIQANHIRHLFNWSMYGRDIIIKDVTPINSLGYSMQPQIFTENTDLAIDYDGQEIKEGMILVYTSNDGDLVGHRVRGVYGEDSFVMRGDNSASTEMINKSKIRYIIIGTLYT